MTLRYQRNIEPSPIKEPPVVDPTPEGGVPFRLEILKRLERELARIPIMENDEILGSSRIKRGRMFFGDDDPLPLLSIHETFDTEWVRGGLALIATAGENLSSRFFDAIDLGPKDSPEGATEYHLRIQGWSWDEPDRPTDSLYPFLSHTQQVLGLVRRKRWHPGDGSIPFGDYRDGPGILGFGDKAPMIDSLEFGRGVIYPLDPDAPSAKAGFALRIVLTLVEDFDNPFVEAV